MILKIIQVTSLYTLRESAPQGRLKIFDEMLAVRHCVKAWNYKVSISQNIVSIILHK